MFKARTYMVMNAGKEINKKLICGHNIFKRKILEVPIVLQR